ncbi:unnamed protein product, partial [Musa acuminata subsp. burmannicoides]
VINNNCPWLSNDKYKHLLLKGDSTSAVRDMPESGWSRQCLTDMVNLKRMRGCPMPLRLLGLVNPQSTIHGDLDRWEILSLIARKKLKTGHPKCPSLSWLGCATSKRYPVGAVSRSAPMRRPLGAGNKEHVGKAVGQSSQAYSMRDL